ncbi:ABC-2 type transport system permease protein [Bacillus tianshenii]|uniref:ABC-2 type transport system permease protein n=1 Tax=Sutcliffiella tianshenii TaxID=1463404 RepID=A0ABS2P3F6_9BACI|nr:ABC transporter permease subunit [Bacillus tianshenii]MBM7621492.1 ABC-2 type transport system permease protein [Bacillus tianshenii]
MIKLVQNELIKWFRRPSFYVMSIILIGLSVIGVVFTIMMGSMMDDPNQGGGQQLGWKEQLQQDNENYKMTMESEPEGDYGYLERRYAINEYRIQNDLEPTTENSVWTYVSDNLGLTSIITLFVVIIAGGTIASEFTWGTIKLLMIRPIKRSRILIAKYLSVLVFMVIFFSIFFVTSFIAGAIAFGMESAPELLYMNGEVFELHPFFYIMIKLLLSSLGVIMFATIAFMISSVFRNNSLAIGISLFLLFTGAQITQLVGMKFEWAKYSPFANTNFNAIIDGMPIVSGTTFWFSIVMYLIYFVLLHVISFFTFVKRDIAA